MESEEPEMYIHVTVNKLNYVTFLEGLINKSHFLKHLLPYDKEIKWHI